MPTHGAREGSSSSGSSSSRPGAAKKRGRCASSSSSGQRQRRKASSKEAAAGGGRRRALSSSSSRKGRRQPKKEQDRGKADRRERDRSKSGRSRRERKRSSSTRRRRSKAASDSPKILRAKDRSRSRGRRERSRSRERRPSRKASVEKVSKGTEDKAAKRVSKEREAEGPKEDVGNAPKAAAKAREKEVQVWEKVERDKQSQENAKKKAEGPESEEKNGSEAKVVAADGAAGATNGQATAPKAAAKAGAGGKAVLGDLAELQKGLERERSMLQLFILKAKQEHEEQKETKDKKAMREKEYFRAEYGEPCGPKNQLILEEELGKGVFSTVFKARDMGASGKEFAVKFIRSNPMLKKATEKEIRLMRRLRNEASIKDPEGARSFLGLAGPETFEYKGHLALVFHLQRCDMRTGLQKYGLGRGLPLEWVRSYARDLFMALRALRAVNVIHSDVKPDNLLISLDKASVRLSDFGSAMPVTERVRTDYLQPRYYRAPEVILGQSYTTQIDVWSAAATVFELATGRILFTGKTNNGMIHQMLKTVGAFPRSFAIHGDTASKHFNKEGDFRLKEAGGEQLLPASHFKKPLTPIPKLMTDVASTPPAGVDPAVQKVLARHLSEMLAQALVPDPEQRATPEQALEHKYFQKLF